MGPPLETSLFQRVLEGDPLLRTGLYQTEPQKHLHHGTGGRRSSSHRSKAHPSHLSRLSIFSNVLACQRYRLPVFRTIICREQMMSAQGCLERVLNTGKRYLPSATILIADNSGNSAICGLVFRLFQNSGLAGVFFLGPAPDMYVPLRERNNDAFLPETPVDFQQKVMFDAPPQFRMIDPAQKFEIQ